MKKVQGCILFLFFLAFPAMAQIDAGATQATKNLYANLKKVAWNGKNILFGQEFFNSYSWSGGNHENEDVSDVKTVTGVHPAVLGQDFHYYVYKSADERRKHKEAALKAKALGCVVTFDFHMYSKYHNSADYAAADRYLMYNIGEGINTYGEVTYLNQQLDQAISILNNDLKFPVVIRLFHEMNGSWFWWGTQAYGGATSYKKLYQYAVNYIKARTNYALFAWSPNYPFDTSYYPTNSYVDVIGLDMYDQGTGSGQSLDVMVTQLTAVSDYAWTNGKVPVFAETGNRINSPDSWPYWWYNVQDKIQLSNRAWKVAWMLTWINQSWGNPPYTAHSGSSTDAKNAFIAFKNMPTTLFQTEALALNLYATPTAKSEAEDAQSEVPGKFSLAGNYPNPFNPGTEILFTLPESGSVTVQVYSLTGQLVGSIQTGALSAGQNSVPFNASSLSSGIYVYRVQFENQVLTGKMMLMK
ncbi:MAG: T9SS type A sorting domain-containing protein [Bacteroidetes bacterium]|nr:T9SS type A sorting domain-containing protein [Bacteroidota bacterium]